MNERRLSRAMALFARRPVEPAWGQQLAETNAIIADIHERQDTIRKTLDRCHAHADAIEAFEASLPLENSNVG